MSKNVESFANVVVVHTLESIPAQFKNMTLARLAEIANGFNLEINLVVTAESQS